MTKEPTKAELQKTIKKLQASERRLLKRVAELSDELKRRDGVLNKSVQRYPWETALPNSFEGGE